MPGIEVDGPGPDSLRIWRQRSQIFMFRGHAIRYWVAGQGEPLLLIHGFPTASWDWHYLWQPLAQRYRVIACDMLGFGDSAKPTDHVYSLLEQADLQQALLAHLNVRARCMCWPTITVTAWPRSCWRGTTKRASASPVVSFSMAACSRKPIVRSGPRNSCSAPGLAAGAGVLPGKPGQ